MRPPRRPTAAERRADLIGRVVAAGDDAERAGYLLARLVKPDDLTALVRVVVPEGPVPPAVFDACADGFSMWSVEQAIRSTDEHAPDPRARK